MKAVKGKGMNAGELISKIDCEIKESFMGTEVEGVENPPIQLKNEGGMVEAVKRLQNYMNTYSDQVGYGGYSVNILLDDILYGLGIAIDEDKYQWASGFGKFKKDLKQYLVENT